MTQELTEQPYVFLVDDDANIRGALTRALTLRGYRVRAFESASAFLEDHIEASAGCLILDYGMPQMDGLALQRHLVEKGISIPIIFITGHGGIPESVEAMKMGALDFLEKPFKQSVLLERIDTALELDRQRREERQKSHHMHVLFETLTSREKEIALLLVMNPGSNSSKDIARTLDISPRTVDHHRARILEKMAVSSVAQLVELALKAGLTS